MMVAVTTLVPIFVSNIVLVNCEVLLAVATTVSNAVVVSNAVDVLNAVVVENTEVVVSEVLKDNVVFLEVSLAVI